MLSKMLSTSTVQGGVPGVVKVLPKVLPDLPLGSGLKVDGVCQCSVCGKPHAGMYRCTI